MLFFNPVYEYLRFFKIKINVQTRVECVHNTSLCCVQTQHNIQASTEFILINLSDHHYIHYIRWIIITIGIF